jgi:hypothetical protein
MWLPGIRLEFVELLALRSFTLRNLSLTGEPLRLIELALALTTLRQRSECEKPHQGDFLHIFLKFPRTGEQR